LKANLKARTAIAKKELALTGAILAVPLTAMVMIILAETPNARFIAVMMSESGDL
jgi:hypothetical protein